MEGNSISLKSCVQVISFRHTHTHTHILTLPQLSFSNHKLTFVRTLFLSKISRMYCKKEKPDHKPLSYMLGVGLLLFLLLSDFPICQIGLGWVDPMTSSDVKISSKFELIWKEQLISFQVCTIEIDWKRMSGLMVTEPKLCFSARLSFFTLLRRQRRHCHKKAFS